MRRHASQLGQFMSVYQRGEYTLLLPQAGVEEELGKLGRGWNWAFQSGEGKVMGDGDERGGGSGPPQPNVADSAWICTTCLGSTDPNSPIWSADTLYRVRGTAPSCTPADLPTAGSLL